MLLKLLKDSFQDNDIEQSKRLLFDLCGDNMRCIPRKGPKKCENNLQDIISLIHITDPNDIPCFVIRDISKLPSISFDHVDVSNIMKEINSLKGNIVAITESQKSSLELIRQLQSSGKNTTASVISVVKNTLDAYTLCEENIHNTLLLSDDSITELKELANSTKEKTPVTSEDSVNKKVRGDISMVPLLIDSGTITKSYAAAPTFGN